MISIKNVSKCYQESYGKFFKKNKKTSFLALNNINLYIKEGESIALIGPNGAGKSTLIKILTGMMIPTSGEVKVFNMNPFKQRKQITYLIGSVFGQKSQLLYHLPVIDSFKLIGAIYGMKKDEIQNRVNELSQTLGFSEYLNKPVRKLSLGERMRVEIAISLIHNPKLLFLDEPTLGLDLVVKDELRAALKKLNLDKKVGIILTSHDIGDVEDISDRICIINKGELVLDKSRDQISQDFLNMRNISINFTSCITDEEYEQLCNLKLSGLRKTSQLNIEFYLDTTETELAFIIGNIDKIKKVSDIKNETLSLEEIIKKIYKD